MIYLLKRTDRVKYDEYYSKVIRAKNTEEARMIANLDVGDEGQIWTDSAKVECVLIPPTGKSAEILGSFNAG